jgi:ATP-dependent helicase Lhr and Lhr-like helicase
VVERFFDGLGGTQLVIHSPLGIRVNRGLGLALRKRLCQTFDFEIQASAIDDAVLLALNSRHSFPPEQIWGMIRSGNAGALLSQAVIDAPMFEVRFRHVATRALSVLRMAGGRKVPAWIQRLRSQELMMALFPARLACFDNRPPILELPSHFIVAETMRECLEESADLHRIEELLRGIESGSLRTLAIDSISPSPFAQRVLLAWDYSFLDDGERANRRSRIVTMNRAIAEEVMRGEDLSALLAPQAVAQVGAEVAGRSPERRARDADELYELIRAHGALPADSLEGRVVGDAGALAAGLECDGRVLRITLSPDLPPSLIAAEDLPLFSAAYPAAGLAAFRCDGGETVEPDEAQREIVRRALRTCGPITVVEVGSRLHLSEQVVARGLAQLEAEGSVFRGHFTTSADEQWCDRFNLEKIHRLTLGALRAEVEPCGDDEFCTFRLDWQHVAGQGLSPDPGEAVLEVLEQLSALPLNPSFWEESVLPARVPGFRPEYIDQLCLAGRVFWTGFGGAAKIGNLPARVAFFPRRQHALGVQSREPLDDPGERAVYSALTEGGAQFLDEIAERAGLSERDTLAALWRLAANAMATNDSFSPLRLLFAEPEAKRMLGQHLRASSSRRDAALRARLKSSLAGRWSVLRGLKKSGDAGGEATHELAMLLLRRHGILWSQMLAAEELDIAWQELTFTLRRLEFAGIIRRGYFVRSLPGEQYALPEALETLRAARARIHSEALVAISAADPANPYGAALPGCGVAREPANLLAIRAGRPVLGLAGRALLNLVEQSEQEFGAALHAMITLRSRIVVQTIDGRRALDSDRVDLMASMGFHSDGRALVYDGLLGPRPGRMTNRLATDARESRRLRRSPL